MLELFFAALVALVLLWSLVGPLFRKQKRRKPDRLRRRRHARAEEAGPPANAIVVDGSNVMHWGGEPSARVLSQVLRGLEKAGKAPIVFFDANVGYVLGDHYFNEARLSDITGLPARHICVVPKGMTADEALLGFAEHHSLRIISNDRYRDWRVRFPYLEKKGVMLRGDYKSGNVVWRGKL